MESGDFVSDNREDGWTSGFGFPSTISSKESRSSTAGGATCVNTTAATQGQRGVDDLVGRTMMECYPGIERTEFFTALRRVMKTGKAETFRSEFTYPTGEVRWCDLLIDAVPDGLCILSPPIATSIGR